MNSHFLPCWRQFQRALRQRNAALRSQVVKKELDSWTRELADCGAQLDLIRQDYIKQLTPLLENMIEELLPGCSVKTNYYCGWDRAHSYEDILQHSIQRDFHSGYTHAGPHRADLKITINHIPAKDILSRGQQKLLVCAMIIARGVLLQNSANNKPVYLVDDLPSELDNINRSNLLTLLSKQDTQIFVTAVECNSLESFLTNKTVKMFHVEHGEVRDVFSNVE